MNTHRPEHIYNQKWPGSCEQNGLALLAKHSLWCSQGVDEGLTHNRIPNCTPILTHARIPMMQSISCKVRLSSSGTGVRMAQVVDPQLTF